MANQERSSNLFPGTGQTSDAPIEQIFREHNETLIRFLQARLNSEADAHEAAQEAYVRLLQLDRPDQPSFLRAYLFKIAANVATDLLRSRRWRHSVSPERLGLSEPAGQERSLVARQDLEAIERALKQLPGKCREIFRLSREEGLSAKEIAERVRLSDRMVRIHLTRALEHIQSAVDQAADRRSRP